MHSEKQPSPHSELKNYPIRVIVAGSRSYVNYTEFSHFMESFVSKYDQPFIFISGKAPRGPDEMIIRWCKEHDHPWVEFPADWDNIDVEGAVIRYRRGKPYNVRAGFVRNCQMGDVATNLIAFWDGVSGGTRQMREYAHDRKLHIATVFVDGEGQENGGQSQSSGKDYSGEYREVDSR